LGWVGRLWRLTSLSTIFQLYRARRSVLLVKETGVPGEVTDKLYHNVVCSTSRHELVAHVVANPTTIRWGPQRY